MTEEQIEKLINKNQELLFVLGFASSLLMALEKILPEEKKGGIFWVIQAIENVVYLDKTLPPLLMDGLK